MQEKQVWSLGQEDSLELLLFSHSVLRQSLQPTWTAARWVSLSFTISQSLLQLTSIESVMPSNCLILCYPLLLLPSIFPSTGSFSVRSGDQSIGAWASASASVLPMNIQGWYHLDLTGLISLHPRDSQVSSPPLQFKCINSLALNLLYGPTLTSIHDYWKNHSFD